MVYQFLSNFPIRRVVTPEEAYKDWVCANTLPYFHQGAPISACSDYCHIVQNRCPYFLPELENQYAGEASFICPDIPVSSMMSGSAESPPYMCHHPCQMSDMSNFYNETNICVRHVDRLSPTLSTSSLSSSSPSVSSTSSATIGSTSIDSDEHHVASSNSSVSSIGHTLCQTTRHDVLVMLLVTCHCLWVTYTQRTLISQTFYCVTGLT
ncbi:hypothetical protein LSAT2_019061 [Lamellibrachia satsuma]|nr:hypothetical protein LSAT2_019061 [Lamellibrachia satsuma]